MPIQKLYIWLIICNICIFAMVVIGAITRLTESGLSMTEWKPLIGAIPPLNEAEWIRVFDLYKQTPEFQKKNFWMEIGDFKTIFFWEWFHRLWGRLIGMVYGLPFLFFLIKGWIPKGYRMKLTGLLLLGGLQGYMGWYMVQSGLVNEPAVSHYRLALHLALAFLIYSLIFWNILDFREKIKGLQQKPDSMLYGYAWICLGMIILTIFWGAYTAGLDAGLVYNDTFPKMGNTWIPTEVWFHKPYWVNFFENHAGVQFTHRWLAMVTAAVIAAFSFCCIKKGRKEITFPLIGCFVFLQVGLGIATLLSGVNIASAVLHQAGALILLSLILSSMHVLRPLRRTPIE
jgi:cytochrome c oxidase assembly protein subunit 15